MDGAQLDTRGRILSAIGHYLSLFERSGSEDRPTLTDLARALDRLVITYYEAPDVEPDPDSPSPPIVDEGPLHDAASAAFPELGWYAISDPTEDTDQQLGLSIATSDLVEIASDLKDVIWLFDNVSESDAIWEFRFGYQTHWGRHLHEVRLYLHHLAAW